MADVIQYRFRLRRGLAADWTTKNEILLEGEFGLELDTSKVKIGDGVTAWNDLDYFGGLAYQEGEGISIDLTDPNNPVINCTLAAVSLSGRVANYAALPAGLGSGDAGKAYLNDDDSMIYVWNGAAFPADGEGYNGGGSSGGSSKALRQAILASSPIAYYQLTAASFSGTTVLDDSGNGHNATIAAAPAYFSRLIPNEEDLFCHAGNIITIGDEAGLVNPMTSSFSVCVVIYSAGDSYGWNGVGGGGIFAIPGPAGETPNTNWQFGFPRTASGTGNYPPSLFWEYGNGTDFEQFIPRGCPINTPTILHVIKDASAKTLKVFRNGVLHHKGSYANEPSGLPPASAYFGGVTGFMGHWALFSSPLSDDEVYAQAKAAGLI